MHSVLYVVRKFSAGCCNKSAHSTRVLLNLIKNSERDLELFPEELRGDAEVPLAGPGVTQAAGPQVQAVQACHPLNLGGEDRIRGSGRNRSWHRSGSRWNNGP